MSKVQFNVRLKKQIADWIANEARRKAFELKRDFSQADVITLMVERSITSERRKRNGLRAKSC